MDLYIGLMSGTSMDGIDAALVDISSDTLIYGKTKQYTDEVKTRIDQLSNGKNVTLADVCQVNTLIGREFAAATNDLLIEAKVAPADIKAIGSHGQTISHDTSSSIPYTMQLGCGHAISFLTGITVVADFRTRDLINGGQGAPFAPLYHKHLFARHDDDVALVNVGGISNISLISTSKPTTGWDVGPGNCLMDAWINKHHGKPFDRNGDWANQGEVILPLLDVMLQDDFIKLSPPKSIGKEYYSLSWLESFLQNEYRPEDVQATLSALTAHCISTSFIENHSAIKTLYLCGGGTHNHHLRQAIASLLPHINVKSTVDAGIDPDYLEAMMFAWLASQTLNQIPVDLRAITGSSLPQILGAIYPVTKSY